MNSYWRSLCGPADEDEGDSTPACDAGEGRVKSAERQGWWVEVVAVLRDLLGIAPRVVKASEQHVKWRRLSDKPVSDPEARPRLVTLV